MLGVKPPPVGAKRPNAATAEEAVLGGLGELIEAGQPIEILKLPVPQQSVVAPFDEDVAGQAARLGVKALSLLEVEANKSEHDEQTEITERFQQSS